MVALHFAGIVITFCGVAFCFICINLLKCFVAGEQDAYIQKNDLRGAANHSNHTLHSGPRASLQPAGWEATGPVPQVWPRTGKQGRGVLPVQVGISYM